MNKKRKEKAPFAPFALRANADFNQERAVPFFRPPFGLIFVSPTFPLPLAFGDIPKKDKQMFSKIVTKEIVLISQQ